MNLLHEPAGDFIVDDDGKGYQDLGEDDYWDEREGEEEGEEAEQAAAAGAGSKKKKAPAKGVNDDDDVPCGPCVHPLSFHSLGLRGCAGRLRGRGCAEEEDLQAEGPHA